VFSFLENVVLGFDFCDLNWLDRMGWDGIGWDEVRMDKSTK
jgi:hypothetical protein